MKINAVLDFWGLLQTMLPTYITSKTRTRTQNSKNVAKVIQRRIKINSFRKDFFKIKITRTALEYDTKKDNLKKYGTTYNTTLMLLRTILKLQYNYKLI